MKEWYNSRTYWFNLLVSIIGILELNFHLLQEEIGAYYGVIFIVISIFGVALRTITTTEITNV